MKALKFIGIALAVLVILTTAALAGIALVGNLNWFKPIVVRQLGDLLGRAVRVEGDLEVAWSLPPALAVNDVSLANASWGSQPQMAEVARIAVGPRWSTLMRGRIELERLSVQGARVILEHDPEGKWNLPQPDRKDDAPPSTGRPLAAVHVEDSHLRLRMGRQDLRFEVQELTLAFGAPGGPTRARGRLRYGQLPLSVDATLAPTAALFGGEGEITLTTAMAAGDNKLAGEGTLASFEMPPQVDIRFDLDAPDLAAITALDNLPAGFKDRQRLNGRLHNGSRNWHYRISDLRFAAGPNDAEGWVELEPFDDPVRLQADLTSGHFDLRPYLPADKAVDAEDGAGAPERVFSKTPFDTDLLTRFNARASVKAGTLLLPLLGLKDLEATLTLEDGRLDLGPLVAGAGGGRFEAEFHLAAGDGPAIETRGQMRRLDLAEMMRILDLPPSLSGRAGFEFDLRGRGASPAELAAALDGRFSMAMQDGRMDARYLEMAGAYGFELTEAFVNLLKPGEEEDRSDEVVIDCAVVSFDIDDGIAASDVLVFHTARAGVVGDGRVDLGSERLDIALKPITGGGINVLGLFRLKAGTTFADAFKLGGTLRAPRILLDKSESAISLGKAIGGMALFGPAGLAAGLLDAEFGSDSPCVRALEAAGAGNEE